VCFFLRQRKLVGVRGGESEVVVFSENAVVIVIVVAAVVVVVFGLVVLRFSLFCARNGYLCFAEGEELLCDVVEVLLVRTGLLWGLLAETRRPCSGVDGVCLHRRGLVLYG